jgi:hypothetical protein
MDRGRGWIGIAGINIAPPHGPIRPARDLHHDAARWRHGRRWRLKRCTRVGGVRRDNRLFGPANGKAARPRSVRARRNSVTCRTFIAVSARQGSNFDGCGFSRFQHPGMNGRRGRFRIARINIGPPDDAVRPACEHLCDLGRGRHRYGRDRDGRRRGYDVWRSGGRSGGGRRDGA